MATVGVKGLNINWETNSPSLAQLAIISTICKNASKNIPSRLNSR